MRLLLAVGGSAGHIYPALAVVEALREMVPELRAFWLGRPGSIEEEIVGGRPDIDFIPFRSSGIPRANVFLGARTLVRLPWSVWRAVGILEEIRPDVVLGMGCYASFAPGMAAHLLRIPLVIHEQNATLGLANRILARFARRILLSFPETLAEVPRRGRARVTGVPVRREVLSRRRDYAARGHLLLLGGSLGSGVLVDALLDAAHILSRLPGFSLYASAGRSVDPGEVEHRFRSRGIEMVRVVRWIEDVGEAFAGARLVVSRAGASTVAEVLAAGRPAILVPWSGAAGRHQDKNARAIAAHGGAVVVEEVRARRGELGRAIGALWGDTERLHALARGAATLARPRAAWEVARELLWVAEGLRWTVPACT
ncbi:MAG: UDP-N-acetylglucosamine--N-acetylmuramyl-(pentapeptide) pyrophosphoryl-undecaprenol N-acetylglucosamine transferase [Caldiserica bacterium]|nr:UDP-N-acetylglucosamine--N-acetylmuramyl-(pentapeptide) pyrophosphoryl-undecaprenol N-acetylglucosamine transferase [Caldisericota bacterium]